MLENQTLVQVPGAEGIYCSPQVTHMTGAGSQIGDREKIVPQLPKHQHCPAEAEPQRARLPGADTHTSAGKA